VTKHEIKRVLDEIAFFLLLKGENPYKARAYNKAGVALLQCPEEVSVLVQHGTLSKVPGIGPATASVITELLTTGASAFHREVQGTYPSSLMELGDVPGLSVRLIKRLYERTGIQTIAELQEACARNRLLDAPQFGPKMQGKVLAVLGEYQRSEGGHLYANVLDEAKGLEVALRAIPGISQVSAAGALRRKLEVIRELSFVVTGKNHALSSVAAHLARIPNVTEVTVHAHTVSARSPLGMPVVIHVAPPRQFAFELFQTTGNDEHLQDLWLRFVAQGFSSWDKVRQRCTGITLTEADIYRTAGLPFLPPEVREGRGELEWVDDTLPSLVEECDIQGCFHTHTTYTDGAGSVEDMVQAARLRGYHYIGISDHSQSAFYVNGLKEDRIRQQWAEIDRVQNKYRDIAIFKGIEADILPDGAMDYPDGLLAQFDFVIASVHGRFNLSEEDQTRRICTALANPYVTMLGHPTGRLLLHRDGYRVNLSEVLDAAARHRKVIEINGSRHRLDLDWRWARIAKGRGIHFCINPDAHAVDEMDNVSLGVHVARKAGLGRGDIINTLSLGNMKALLGRARA
jgi:DNA polymerase (family 10)